MKLEFAYYGNPILRKKGLPIKEITPEIRDLVEGMVDTLIKHNGIGLAAPQVSQSLRLFITAVPIEKEDGSSERGPLRVFINPEILSYSDEMDSFSEGCLSIPKLNGVVWRPTHITVRAMNLEGEIFELELQGLDARCVLHENDHINGVLYIDRLDKKERLKMEPKLKAIKKKYNAQD